MNIPGLNASTSSDKYYDVMGLPKSATDEEVKKKYRKLALTCHPDKHPDKADQFRELSAAYTVLSDPNKRKIYDKFGERGLQMLEMGMFGEDGSRSFAAVLLTSPSTIVGALCLACLLASTLCVFPLLFALKWDDPLLMPWNNVFIPLWLVFAVAVPLVVGVVRGPWPARILLWLRVLAVLAFFIVLNHTLNLFEFADFPFGARVTGWSGWFLFAPLIVHEALALLYAFASRGIAPKSYRAEREIASRHSTLGLGYIGWLLRRALSPLLRLALWCTLASCIDERKNLQLALAPLALVVLWSVLTRAADAHYAAKAARMADSPPDQPPPPSPAGAACRAFCGTLLAFSFVMIWAGLYLTYMTARTDNDALDTTVELPGPPTLPPLPWSAVVSFIPVWIAALVLVLACCCICCCGSCLACTNMDGLDEAPLSDEEAAAAVAAAEAAEAADKKRDDEQALGGGVGANNASSNIDGAGGKSDMLSAENTPRGNDAPTAALVAKKNKDESSDEAEQRKLANKSDSSKRRHKKKTSERESSTPAVAASKKADEEPSSPLDSIEDVD